MGFVSLKNKQFTRLLLVVGIAIIGFLLYKNTNSTGGIGLNDFALPLSKTKDIDQIFISANNTKLGFLMLNKKNQNEWFVSNGKDTFATDTQYVYRILNWLLPRMQVKNPVADNALNNVQRNMALNAKKVIFYKKGKPYHTIFVGGPSPNGMATNMFIPGASRPAVVEIKGFTGSLDFYFDTDIQNWTSSVLLQYELADIAKVEVNWPAEAAQSFFITSNRNGLQLQGVNGIINGVSKTRLQAYLAMYRLLSRESGLLPGINRMPELKNKILTSQPYVVLKVTNTRGVVKTLTLYKKPVNDIEAGITERIGELKQFETDLYYCQINKVPELYLVQQVIFGKTLKKLSDFLN